MALTDAQAPTAVGTIVANYALARLPTSGSRPSSYWSTRFGICRTTTIPSTPIRSRARTISART